GVAVHLGRQGRQGPPLLRLGVRPPGRPRPCTWRSGWAALAAGPPQPQDRRAGLLPLLHTPPHPAGRPGQSRRAALDHRGALSNRQGPLWPGRPSGPPLALLVSLDHPGHARPRLPGGRRPDRPPPPPPPLRPPPFLGAPALPAPPPPPPPELIGLTCNEVQHLLAALLARPAGDHGHRLGWSLWRRRHQGPARPCPYQRQP